MTSRIAIIGAGKRVRYTVLPAVLSLGDKVDVVAIHTRNPFDVPMPGGDSLPTRTDLASLDLGSVDIVIIAVGSNSIRGVLSALEKKPGREKVSLVMDTPPLRLSEIRKLQTFRPYKSVIVGEDWIKLAPVIFTRSLLARGVLGTLKSITLDQMSYRYHGLATLRAIAGSNWFRSMRVRPLSGSKSETTIVTGNGVHCHTIQPRNYSLGHFLVEGSAGLVTNKLNSKPADRTFLLEFPEEYSGWYQPMTVNGTLQEPDAVEAAMAEMPFDFLEDPSYINRLKIAGYARLLEDLVGGRATYDIVDGLYDYMAIVASEKLGRFVDVGLSGGRTSLVRSIAALHG